ncbi:MAG: NlpC/P60 family protein [Thermomicrobiales bacterium]
MITPRGYFVEAALSGVGGAYCTPPDEPRCTDCSGFVVLCWRQATGHDLTGDSHAQFQLGREVSGALQPGDLIFSDTQGGREVRLGNRASHVAIYVGNGEIVNALNERAGIVRGPADTAYWRPLRLGVRRLFDDAGYIVPLPGLASALPEPPGPDPAGPARPPQGHRWGSRRDRGRLLQRIQDRVRRRRRMP